jgi:uncharacterized protein YegL
MLSPHILLDSSGSMHGSSIFMASEACFAIASALHDFKGINLGVTMFPGHTDQMVAPILRHNEKMHSRFGMDASGCTPMDAALWWILQQIHPLTEPRKMVAGFLAGSGTGNVIGEQIDAKIRMKYRCNNCGEGI